MCGIVGYVGGDLEVSKKKTVLNKQMDIIKHRGPSGSGEYIDDQVALGFRRLSIIDLTKGDQPIYNEDHSKLIFFNGEIYNYQTVRKELVEMGHTFQTDSDTETILHGFEQWGKDVLKKIRGMFVFVVYDLEKQTLFGARDFFGIKPMYYTILDDGTFMFSSEIKTFMAHPDFHPELNKDSLKSFLMNQYNDLHETFFKGVYRFPEGHYFTYEAGDLKIEKYWDVEFNPSNLSFEEEVKKIDESVTESIKLHNVADVPVGSFLSEGVDSSYVTSVLKPKEVFSVGFDNEVYDEVTAAKELANSLDLNFNETRVSGDDVFEAFDKIQYYLDEPDGNPSCVPLWFLTKFAREKVTVALSGEGADELFAGYVNYGMHSHNGAIKSVTSGLTHLPTGLKNGLASVIKKMPHFPGQVHMYTNLASPNKFYTGQSVIYDLHDPSIFQSDEVNQYLTADYRNDATIQDNYQADFKKVSKLDNVKQMQYIDFHHFMLNDILQKADKMSMAHSLELRVPFLDPKVAETAAQVPTKYLMNKNDTKYAFRKAAGKHLPQAWADRPKLGFPVPIKQWLRDDKYYQKVKDLFSEGFVSEFFDQDKIIALLDDNKAGRVDGRRKIWTIFTFLTWYKVYFINVEDYLKLG
ncbi:asparagine synthase (glutamine-hydrolyzing) [Lactobacillus sp. YT155]|uniref:asparagine synthase (glutamine-hydrolyzing) n=1 Tax=Lactobacillus sp. YT155 TaxID=3060955 RepID=UPI00265E8EBB|nr:asparagine synthase (glutamine-hydrolyzing) [Lactobacillus sp. YT155]MDO1604630.1 asparagine synthase (glutamine-hydrolyzing) [Lactobacillus sp. YT155]